MSIHRLHGLYRYSTPSERLEGRRWYAEAAQDIASIGARVGRDAEDHTVAGVAAALSPLTRWERCLLDTQALVQAFEDGKSPEDITVTTPGTNRDRAWRILEGEHPLEALRGAKTRAFFRNLRGDWSVPTIDSHAINAWHGRRVAGSRTYLPREVTTIRRVTEDYIRASVTHELTPAEFQAIVWVSWRRRIRDGKVPGYARR